MKIIVVRRETFCASHRLHNPDCSEAWNLETYGQCCNPNGHGHNYALEVQVAGPIDQKTGMSISIHQLKKIIKEEILDKVDHRHLNLDVPFLSKIIPTTENVAKVFWDILDKKLPPNSLYKIILHETEKNWVEICRN